LNSQDTNLDSISVYSQNDDDDNQMHEFTPLINEFDITLKPNDDLTNSNTQEPMQKNNECQESTDRLKNLKLSLFIGSNPCQISLNKHQ